MKKPLRFSIQWHLLLLALMSFLPIITLEVQAETTLSLFLVSPYRCDVNSEKQLTNCKSPVFNLKSEEPLQQGVPYETQIQIHRTASCHEMRIEPLLLEYSGNDSRLSMKDLLNLEFESRKVIRLGSESSIADLKIKPRSKARWKQQLFPENCEISISVRLNQISVHSLDDYSNLLQNLDSSSQGLGLLLQAGKAVEKLLSSLDIREGILSQELQNPLNSIDWTQWEKKLEVIQDPSLVDILQFAQQLASTTNGVESEISSLPETERTQLTELLRQIQQYCEAHISNLQTQNHQNIPPDLCDSSAAQFHFQRLMFDAIEDEVLGPTGLVERLASKL